MKKWWARFGTTAACVLAIVLASSGIAQAQAPSPCPDNMTSYATLGDGESVTCGCSAAQLASGAVWGTGRYTMDSSICRAARHAGVIPAEGGSVTAYRAAGCTKFEGSSANGITTSDWGPFEKSFTFTWPAPECAKAPEGAVEPCPGNLLAFRGMPPGQTLTCICGPTQFAGTVWGTGRYTADSSTCGAALHAGAVEATGGQVTITTYEGCQAFTGSTANGITSQDWGPFTRTFSFTTPVPACVK